MRRNPGLMRTFARGSAASARAGDFMDTALYRATPPAVERTAHRCSAEDDAFELVCAGTLRKQRGQIAGTDMWTCTGSCR